MSASFWEQIEANAKNIDEVRSYFVTKLRNNDKPRLRNEEEIQQLHGEKDWIHKDFVLGLLREKTRQIQKIMDEDYWTANYHLNKIRERILAVLEEKKE